MSPMINNPAFNFTLAQLEICDLAATLDLQQIVFNALPEEHKTYIVPKSEEKLSTNLSSPNCATGVFTTAGQLVGMAFLIEHREENGFNGVTDCPELKKIVMDSEKTGVICTVMVHPQYRKHKLMEHMLLSLQDIAERSGFTTMITEVVPTNEASYKGFLHQGFIKKAHDIDPSDGTPLLFLTKPVSPTMDKTLKSNLG